MSADLNFSYYILKNVRWMIKNKLAVINIKQHIHIHYSMLRIDEEYLEKLMV